MISLVPCKDPTRKYVMICMTSYMILVWNQGSGDPVDQRLNVKVNKSFFQNFFFRVFYKENFLEKMAF